MENMTKNHPGGHFHNCCDFEKLHRHRPLTSPLPNRSHRISDLMQLRFVDDLRLELLFRATLGDIGCEPTPEKRHCCGPPGRHDVDLAPERKRAGCRKDIRTSAAQLSSAPIDSLHDKLSSSTQKCIRVAR
jgi:hypothetical protein